MKKEDRGKESKESGCVIPCVAKHLNDLVYDLSFEKHRIAERHAGRKGRKH